MALAKVPAVHATQAAGADAYVPAGQDVLVKAQDAAPEVLYVSAAQAAQEAVAAPLKVPAGQAVGAAEPTGQNAPGGQTSHVELEVAPMA